MSRPRNALGSSLSVHMLNSQPSSRRRLLWFLLWPFWRDTLEPLMFAIALGSAFASVLVRGEPNVVAILIVGMSYTVAVLTRWRDRRSTCRTPLG